jgi:hypothetical protein
MESAQSNKIKLIAAIVLPPLLLILLVPYEWAGKLSIAAFVLFGIGVLVLLRQQKKVEDYSTDTRLSAMFFEIVLFSLPLLGVGSCFKHNSISPYQFVLFNGSDKTISVAMDDRGIRLEPKQIYRESFRRGESKFRITDPKDGKEKVMDFNSGITFLAYGNKHELQVQELIYVRYTLLNPNPKGGNSPPAKHVKNAMLTMDGEFMVYVPGDKIPEKMQESIGSQMRFLALSIH